MQEPTLAITSVFDIPCSRKVLSKLMERCSHDAIGCVEGLLHAVPVVNVDVDVKHTHVSLEKLDTAEVLLVCSWRGLSCIRCFPLQKNGSDDVSQPLQQGVETHTPAPRRGARRFASKTLRDSHSENAVVDVTESGGLALLCVVQTTGPVDHNVGFVRVQPSCAPNAATGVELAKLKETVEDGAVFSHVEALQLSQVLVHVIRRDRSQKINIVVRVKPSRIADEEEAGVSSGRWNDYVSL